MSYVGGVPSVRLMDCGKEVHELLHIRQEMVAALDAMTNVATGNVTVADVSRFRLRCSALKSTHATIVEGIGTTVSLPPSHVDGPRALRTTEPGVAAANKWKSLVTRRPRVQSQAQAQSQAQTRAQTRSRDVPGATMRVDTTRSWRGDTGAGSSGSGNGAVRSDHPLAHGRDISWI